MPPAVTFRTPGRPDGWGGYQSGPAGTGGGLGGTPQVPEIGGGAHPAGVFAQAVDAIKEAQRPGFCVTTNTMFFNTDTPETVIEVPDYLNDELDLDGMMVAPAYAYEKAPDQDHFLGVTQARNCSARRSATRRSSRTAPAKPRTASSLTSPSAPGSTTASWESPSRTPGCLMV